MMKAKFDNGTLVIHARSHKETEQLADWMNDAMIMGVQCSGGVSALDPTGKKHEEAVMHLRVSDRPLLVDTAAGPRKAVRIKTGNDIHTVVGMAMTGWGKKKPAKKTKK